MKKLTQGTAVILLASILLFSSCVASKLEKRLDPVSEEFFDKVRYIITKEESKIFLELPPSARAEFIENFWKRRDPTPGTERNEYREVYFARIEEANRLFGVGGRPGWLQDRGRVYILFGPPNERQENPMGGRPMDPYATAAEMTGGVRVATGDKPNEVWVYYNLFSSLQKPHTVRLIFVDTHGTGDYRLTTNLDELIPGTMGAETQFAPNLVITHELHKEEAIQARRYLKRALFNFSWEFIKTKDKGLGSNLLILVLLPYEKIIFDEEEDRLSAKLELEIQVKSDSGETVWQYGNEYTLDLSERFLESNKGGVWEAEIPVTKWLEKGEHSVYLRLKNLSGDQEVEKLLPLKM